jgi:uncharacterized protein
MTRVVVAGASGFMGRRIVADRRRAGEDVRTIGGAGADATWGDTAAITRLVDGADLLVNLAGRSVNCRYTPANREEIRRSRVETTAELARAVAAAAGPPPLWINSSTATIYRHADDRPQSESTGELGTGFSVGIAKAWERTFFEPDLPGVRRVAIRTAIVLGRGSVLVPLTRLVRFGLGGAQLDGRWPGTPARIAAGVHHRFQPGSAHGRQRFSWVHIDDVIAAIAFLRDHAELDGVVNLVAPEASDNRTLMADLRSVLGMPIGLPATRWMLELGTFAIRTETELVLKSRWVVPERLLAAGFRFEHTDLRETLRSILRR